MAGRVIIVMGVSGCGKSTIAKALAQAVGYMFADADDYHSPENKTKMAGGQALTDGDRVAWLDAINKDIITWCRSGKQVVLACSALKESYRKQLAIDGNVIFIYLKGSFALIEERLKERRGHFMNPQLLKSQFEILEEPGDAIVADISRSQAAIIKDLSAIIIDG